MNLELYKERIKSILSTSDLETTTPKSIRKALEEEYGVDLSEFKSQLKELVYSLLQEYEKIQGEEQDIKEETSNSHNVGQVIIKNDKEELLERDEEFARQLQQQEYTASSSRTRHGSSVKRKTMPKKAPSSSKRKSPSNSGFTKLQLLSPSLSSLLNAETLSRPEVVKQIWAYIKQHELQDPKDKRYILCDQALESVFGKKRVGMFGMNKILSKHLKAVSDVTGMEEYDEIVSDDEEEDPQDPQEEGADGLDVRQDSSQSLKKSKKTKPKPSNNKNNAFNKPMQLSTELSNILKTESLSRPQVVKQLWEYIKQHELQDPQDKRFILCDEALERIFKQKRTLSLHLTRMDGEPIVDGLLSEDLVVSDDDE